MILHKIKFCPLLPPKKEKQSSSSPHIDLIMLWRYPSKAVVGVSCLQLMIAYQPVKACSCSEPTDEQHFCRAEKLCTRCIKGRVFNFSMLRFSSNRNPWTPVALPAKYPTLFSRCEYKDK
ncbi:hypothetical protein CHS0354_007947 [Potamilus streckersoni]|uniref:Uncharacterized protein n=1 Tax=Potamilus streckersoni TaxID=2493646 RepID=A0AAE0S8T8_9BIVA|nr:hypothetical protein CHS0354_007947 [Potamilus streckersoni]